MRLFAAVLPPPDVLDHLEQALTSVRGPFDADDARGPLRWTLPEDRHLTLAFYGEVPDGYLDEISEALEVAVADHQPLPLMLRGAGSFDRRTLWVGCGGDTSGLADVTAACVDVGAQVLGRSDDRPRSRAHLTVARVRAGARSRPARHRDDAPRGRVVTASGDVAELAHALAVYTGPSWTVVDVVLVASQLGAGPSGHPRHDVVGRFPLAPVAG